LTVSDLVTMMIAFVVIKLGRHRDRAHAHGISRILGGGTFFFVVLLPAALFRAPRQ
jgi:hypothetical protein